jgi:hypothetical protein
MGVEESESEVERVRMEILAAIDNAMERVFTVVSDERGKREQNVPEVTGVMDGVHSTVLLLLMYVISLLLLMLPVVRLQSCWRS